MATRTTVEIEDDIDGTPGADTVRFEFDGTEYEIDLSEQHRKEFLTVLEPYMESGRRAGSRSRRGNRRASEKDGAAIRAWAAQQGIELSERGRIPASVKKRYAEAH